jgi:flagellar protein FlbT
VPLIIEFKSGDKLIINGAVMENAGSSTKLLIRNNSAVLREKEVLSIGDSKTPASRVYFALQCAYIFADKKEEHLRQFEDLINDFLKASPSSKDIIDAIKKEVEAGRIYKALKKSQTLISYEAEIFRKFGGKIEQELEEGPDLSLPAGETERLSGHE